MRSSQKQARSRRPIQYVCFRNSSDVQLKKRHLALLRVRMELLGFHLPDSLAGVDLAGKPYGLSPGRTAH